MMTLSKIAVLAATSLALSGCIVGAAVNVVGETAEAAVELTGATIKTTAGVTGAVIGGTVDAIIPGDQSAKKKEKDEKKK